MTIDSRHASPAASGPGKAWRRFSNLALALASVLFTVGLVFAAGELFLRAQVGFGSLGELRDIARFDAQRGWVLQPGRYSHVDLASLKRVDIAINELGMRGPAAALAAGERTTLVGDSFLFAAALDDAGSVAGRLRGRVGPRHEIVNLSVPGYGTGQQFLALRELLARGYDPGQRIVLFMFSNDIMDNLGLEYRSGKPHPELPVFDVVNGELNVARAPMRIKPVETAPSTEWRSLFFVFLRGRAMTLALEYPWLFSWALDHVRLPGPLMREPGLFIGWYREGWRERWDRTSAILDLFVKRFGVEAGRKIAIVYIPSPIQVDAGFRDLLRNQTRDREAFADFRVDPERPQRVIGAFSAERGIAFHDLTPDMIKGAASTSLFLPGDGHFNASGAALAADSVYAALFAPKRP